MHAISYLIIPARGSPYLLRTTVAFDNQQVASQKSVLLKLTIKQFDLVDLVQLQFVAEHVGHSQERSWILVRSSLGLLLNAASNLCNIAQCRPLPMRWHDAVGVERFNEDSRSKGAKLLESPI